VGDCQKCTTRRSFRGCGEAVGEALDTNMRKRNKKRKKRISSLTARIPQSKIAANEKDLASTSIPTNTPTTLTESKNFHFISIF
jgi:hypothetical protein